MNWQPISTAPQDGQWVLAWRDGTISQCQYRPAFINKDEIVLGGNGWNYAPWAMPTHWAPMPDGPEASDEGNHGN